MKNLQRPLNSATRIIDKPNVARDGTPKRTHTSAIAHGMRDRRAEVSGMPGFSNPLDDETLEKNWQGRQTPLHSSSESDPKRGGEPLITIKRDMAGWPIPRHGSGVLD